MEKLKIIHFKEMLHAWSMSVVLSQTKIPYNSRFPLAALDTLLTPAGEKVTLDDKKAYRQLTLKTNGGGIVVRNETKKSGKEIKTRRQTKVEAGQFLFSKIDARNGAFGIVPKELNGAVVTAEFPVFAVNAEKVIPEFLLLVMTSEEMTAYIKSMAQGSTNRKRLDETTFLKIQVPLPSMEEQMKMMAEYEAMLKKVVKIENEQDALPVKIQKEVFEKTNTTIKRNKSTQRLSVSLFKEMETWSVENALGTLKVESDYPLVRIGDWIEAFMKDADGATLRVTPKKNPSGEYLYIGMEDVEKGTGRMNGFKGKIGAEIRSGAMAVPHGYFIYGKLRPNLNKYWVNTKNEENVVCSTEFFVFSLKQGVDKAYFECVLSSDIIQEQVKRYITGTGLPRINADDFLHLQIPNPPLEVQKQLGNYFKSKQRILWDGRGQIASERERTKKEIESQIFEQL